MRIFELGAVTSYIATFISQAIEKEFFDNEIVIDIGESIYLSTTIAGAFSAIIISKTSLFQGVVAAVALNKALRAVLESCLKGKKIDEEKLLRDFIFDSILVFYIVLLLKRILTIFDNGQCNDSNEELDNEYDNNNNQTSTLLTDTIVSIVINLYYVFKKYQIEDDSSNNKNKLTD